MDLELQTLRIEKRNVSFFTVYFITCFFYLVILRNHVLFAGALSYKCQIFSVSLFSFQNLWSGKSMVFTSCFYLEGYSWRMKCDYSEVQIQNHAALPSFSCPYRILHYSRCFPTYSFSSFVYDDFFFPKENLQLIFKGSTEDLPPISFWHRPQRIDLQKRLLTLYIQTTHSSVSIGSSS